MPAVKAFALIVAAYAAGSIPFAVLMSRRAGVDVRQSGSGNPGATNVFRTAGPGLGIAVAVLDIAKGAVGVLAAEWLHAPDGVAAAAGVAAVIGHVFPVWLRFHGGKGVATACGAFLVLAPVAAALAASVFLVVVWITRYVSLGSIVAAAALPIFAYADGSPVATIGAAFAVAALVLIRHSSNMTKLLAGVEARI